MKDIGTCTRCGSAVWIPDDLYVSAKRSEKISFYCSFGHGMHFPQGESEAEKLRRERDRLAQRVAERDDELTRVRGQRDQTEKRLAATKGVVTRIKNRVGRGVCPCCNRTFENVHRHMTTQHPTYAAEAAE